MSSNDQPKDTEEALRRKEKELQKRDAQLKELRDELDGTRERVEAHLQELEAREIVMNDAEMKHGSLLQREEMLAGKERDVTDKEKMLQERFAEASRREKDLESATKQRQKEYEDKLFPLAAREQEIIRRESEVHAMEVEHEAKVRAFAKKVSSEEERERAKEKAMREHEQSIKELQQAADQKQSEVDQQNQLLQQRQQVLKAEQVELESRDRDLKWRDDQLRRAHQEVHDMKERLMAWERTLTLREEETSANGANVNMQRSQLELRELELSERTSKLLQAEKEVSEREAALDHQVGRTQTMTSSIEERVATIQARERTIADQRIELDSAKQRIEILQRQADERNEDISKRVATLEERERALKQWIVELEFREKKLSAAASAAFHGTGGSGSSAPKGDMNFASAHVPPGAHVPGGGPQRSVNPDTNRTFHKGLVKMKLGEIQSRYIGATAAQSALAANRREQGRRAVDISSTLDDYTQMMEQQAAAEEMALQLDALEDELNGYSGRFYCMEETVLEKIFAPSELRLLRELFTDGATRELAGVKDGTSAPPVVDEYTFLQQLQRLGAKKGQPSPKDPTFGSNFTTAQWNHLWQQLRSNVASRQTVVVADRLSKVAQAVDVLRDREELYPDEFPQNPHAVLASMRGPNDVAPIRKKNILNHGPLPNTNSFSKPKQGGDTTKSNANSTSVTPTLTPRMDREDRSNYGSPGETMEQREKKDPERTKLLKMLPSYLRHHYE